VHVDASSEPGICDSEGHVDGRVKSSDLTGINLDLESNGAAAVFCVDAKTEFGGNGALDELCPSKPRFENRAKAIKDGSDRSFGGADKVDILRVPERAYVITRRPRGPLGRMGMRRD